MVENLNGYPKILTGGRYIDGCPEVYVSGALVEMGLIDMSVPCPLDDSSEVEEYDPRVV
jgi:hypothetical protein